MEQWGLDKVNTTRCRWTGVVITVRKQYTIFLLIKCSFWPAGHTVRATKLQFPGHFWPAGYGLHTPTLKYVAESGIFCQQKAHQFFLFYWSRKLEVHRDARWAARFLLMPFCFVFFRFLWCYGSMHNEMNPIVQVSLGRHRPILQAVYKIYFILQRSHLLVCDMMKLFKAMTDIFIFNSYVMV